MGGALKHPWTIFVSPDHRFISGWMLDTKIDPEEEARDEARRLNSLLLSQQSPQQGVGSDRVTVVEFGDFECPFCKRSYQWIKSLPPDTRNKVRLVFKHLPLPQHPWAHEAALMSACAETQSDEAFWMLHDFIFDNQDSLNSANLETRIRSFASGVAALNMQQWTQCIARKDAEEVISRDAMLAALLQVNHTPTIFVNGERIGAVQSGGELAQILEQAWELEMAQRARGGQRQAKNAEH